MGWCSHLSLFAIFLSQRQAVAAQEFVTSFTSGKKVDLTQAWQSSHRYSDGTCAMLAWVEFEEFQVHFVEQFRKYQGEGLNVREIEEELTLLHGDMSRKDAFFDNHIGFEVEDLCPFVELLKHSNEPYLLDGSSLYIQLPGGIIFRLIGPSCPLDSNNLSISAV